MKEHDQTSEESGTVKPSSESPRDAVIASYFNDLKAIEEGSGDVAAVRRALQRMVFETVERIWEGDTEVVAEYLDKLQPAVRRIRKVLGATVDDPVVEVMRYSHDMMQVLLVMDQALENSRIEMQLRAVASEIKRAVLQVLRAHAEERHLSRSDVHKLLVEQGHEAPTPQRIGQILEEMHGLNLVTRVELTARGGRAAHYRLSPAGRQLCARLTDNQRGREITESTGGPSHSAEEGGTRKALWLTPAQEDEVLKRRMPSAAATAHAG